MQHVPSLQRPRDAELMELPHNTTTLPDMVHLILANSTHVRPPDRIITAADRLAKLQELRLERLTNTHAPGPTVPATCEVCA
jgi:hypothetical protein